MCTSVNKAGYGHLRMGNSKMQSLILNKSAALKDSNVFFRPSPHANLRGTESRATATNKMEFFDHVTLCLGILERNTNALVAEARALYGE